VGCIVVGEEYFKEKRNESRKSVIGYEEERGKRKEWRPVGVLSG